MHILAELRDDLRKCRGYSSMILRAPSNREGLLLSSVFFEIGHVPIVCLGAEAPLKRDQRNAPTEADLLPNLFAVIIASIVKANYLAPSRGWAQRIASASGIIGAIFSWSAMARDRFYRALPPHPRRADLRGGAVAAWPGPPGRHACRPCRACLRDRFHGAYLVNARGRRWF